VEPGNGPCRMSPRRPQEAKPSQEGDGIPLPEDIDDMSSVSTSAQSCQSPKVTRNVTVTLTLGKPRRKGPGRAGFL